MCAKSGRAVPVLRCAGDEPAYAETLLRRTYAFEAESAPSISGRVGEIGELNAALDVVRVAIERSFRASANPQNVLCKGMCRRLERGRDAALRGSAEVSVRCETSAYAAFKSPIWDTFCERAGVEVMIHVLLFCSVFVRVGIDRDSPLLQICGYPINNAMRKRAVSKALATSKDRAIARREARARKRQRREERSSERGADANDSTAVKSKFTPTKQLTLNPFISSVDVEEVIRLSDVYRASQVSVDEDDGTTREPSTAMAETSSTTVEVSKESEVKKKPYRKPSWLRKRIAKRNVQVKEVPTTATLGKVVNRSSSASRGNEVKIANTVYDRGVFMFRSSFTKKPGLPAGHALKSGGSSVRAARRLYLAIFKTKKLTKTSSIHKTRRAIRHANSTYRLPRKFRMSLLPALQAMIEGERRCAYSRLLNRRAPMPRKLMVSSSRVDNADADSLLSAYTSPRQVVAFVWDVIERIVPDALLGSSHTRGSLRATIRRIVSMRRYERITLHEVMQGIRTSDFTCFKATTTNKSNAGQAEASQRRMATRWIGWLLEEFIFPIIRAHFYVTDTQLHKNRIFFYRKGIWSRLVTATLQSLEGTSFKLLSAREAMTMLDRASVENNLGFSNMRFLPKGTGLRPIATLNKPTTFAVKLRKKSPALRVKKFEAINNRLKDVQDILHHEAVSNPDVMGSAVGDYKNVLLRLGPCLRTIRRQRMLGRNIKPCILATDIKGAFDNLPLESLERVATNLISSCSYQALHYAVVKHNGEAKYKKLVSSLGASGSEETPGPLYTEANRRTNTGGVAILKRESRNSIVVDAGFAKTISDANVAPLLRAHLRENIVSARGKYLLQTVGIPQGSIVSPLLCSLFYGHLEHEYRLLSEFCSDHSTVCRWMDDILVVGTDKEKAASFFRACKRSFEEHGCSLNEEKTLCNFDHGEDIQQKTFVNADGRSYIPWCGLLIDCLTLEVLVDYSRYSGEFVREAMNMPLGRKVWAQLPDRICGFIKPKCAGIFYDESINSKVIVRVNVFQLFLMAAMKTHSYVVAAGSIPGCNSVAPIALFRAIKRAVRFGQILIRRQSAVARAHCGSVGEMSNSHIEFLAIKAFLRILGQKQSRYTRVIQLLNSRLTSNDMKRSSRNALLARAMDPSRHMIFSHIRF
nr:telomerase reverse transcriptase [Ostreococcus tauri]